MKYIGKLFNSIGYVTSPINCIDNHIVGILISYPPFYTGDIL